MPGPQLLVDEFVSQLRKRKVEGSQATAQLTAELLRTVISQLRAAEAPVLIETVRKFGRELIAANPFELSVGNIVRRVLRIIREEDASGVTYGLPSDGDNQETADCTDGQVSSADVLATRRLLRSPSLHGLLDRVPNAHADDMGGKRKAPADKNAKAWMLKHNVMEAINELVEEISGCHQQIAEQALELIHHNEVILTFGKSKSVMEFLCAAKKKRSFRVYVAEGAPKYQGHCFAKDLSAEGFRTTLITDSAVFAMISRVNMVVVGAHTVMANGGIIGPVGLNMLALAAKQHGVPFVVVAATHKLCPLYPENPVVRLNELKSPSDLLQFGEFSECMELAPDSSACVLNVVNPAFDYVPPQLINLFITDIGGHNPSFMYRLIADYYSADDFIL
ncbi:unnamed protein product [Linum trigynum]|uniref:Translation initiation factor eIF2B subunit beta n=1 Tax=Linum trigynum TaxID=586398 RepID=A0AAV2CHI9_9ROSI